MLLNPLDIMMWTFRRSGRDVVKLYDSLSPVMRLATGGAMLNFGYWPRGTVDPVSAQQNLCELVDKVAGLSFAKKMLDVGSGLAAPARYWRARHPSIEICCVNINFNQLAASASLVSHVATYGQSTALEHGSADISLLNATSAMLPMADSSVDMIVALESAQHFRPIADFVAESARSLKPGGKLLIAIPVLAAKTITPFFTLGILSMTWSSEHYTLGKVQSAILQAGLEIAHESHIGDMVYEPMADYYIQNREKLTREILKMYPSYVEKILYRSILKMKKLSEKRIIDYVLIKGQKN